MSALGIVLSAVGVVLAAVVTGFFGYLVARQSRGATDRATEVTAENNELAAWQRLAGEYRDDRDEMRKRLDRLEDRANDQDTALRNEQLKREGMARELERERERMNSLEKRFRAAVTYIQSLLTLLRNNDIDTPPPPEGLGLAD